MTIKQLSIFVENRSGSLATILKVLKDNDINIIASTLGDTDGFGIYRVICSDNEKAFRLLHSQGISVTLSNVYGLALRADKVGAAADVMSIIATAGVGIKYMYSFLFEGKGIMVFRTDDTDLADKTIMLEHLSCLSEDDLRGAVL